MSHFRKPYALASLVPWCFLPPLGCHEKGPSVIKDEGTGGSEGHGSSCSCQPLDGSTNLTVLTERDCYCENIGACPVSIDAAKKPGMFVRVVEYRCEDGLVLISRTNEIEGHGYIFVQQTLVGAYLDLDYVSSCGLSTMFGVQIDDKSACDYCITSHGTQFVASEYDCLSLEDLPDGFATGVGGAAGESSTG